MLRRTNVVVFVSLLLIVTVTGACGDLYSEFKNPLREYSPVPFWFLNSTLEKEEIEWQIDQMIEQGVYGAFMHGRTGLLTPYFSKEWWQAIGAAVEHGAAKGFHAWIYDEYNWPSGHAHGEVMRGHPEFFPRNIELSSEEVEGPAVYATSIDSDRLVAVLASRMTDDGLAPDPSENLTSLVQDGVLEWDVPAGRHMIMVAREVMHDHYVDLLNADAMDRFLELTHREYFRRFGDHFSGAIPGTFTDEPNIRSFFNPAWSADFLQHFEDSKGYDLTPYLGALFHDMGESTIKIRCDYYDVVTTLFERNYWGLIGEWAEEHGIVSTGHLKAEESLLGHLRMAGDAMRVMRHAQIPGVDLVIGPRLLEVEAMKLASSVARLYGHERVMSESFAGCGHGLTFEEMKWMSDWQHAGGVNLFTPHAFHYSIEGPGDSRRNDWPPSMFYQQPYWPYYSHYANYISRLSRMLAGGVHVADIAVHYPMKTIWANSGPVGTDDTITPEIYTKLIRQLFDHNMDFNLLDDDSLERAVVENGLLRIGDLSFRAVVLPASQVLTRAGAEKLIEFRSQGGVVVCVNRRPTASAEEGEGDEVVARAAEMMLLTSTVESADIMLRLLVPADFNVILGEKLYYKHVKHDDADVYFVSSQSDKAQSALVRFRSTGYPELWDPETGDRYSLEYRRIGNVTQIPIQLGPYGSCLVVFGSSPSSSPPVPVYLIVKQMELPDTWDFDAKPHHYRGEEFPPGYDPAAVYPTRVSIGDWVEQGMETFSGTGIYTTNVTINRVPDGHRVMLDLGDVRVAASVYVNGENVGTRIWRPFVFDLTEQVRPGRNEIRVEVANTIANRMTLYTGGRWDSSPEDRLVSGILGPVQLSIVSN